MDSMGSWELRAQGFRAPDLDLPPGVLFFCPLEQGCVHLLLSL